MAQYETNSVGRHGADDLTHHRMGDRLRVAGLAGLVGGALWALWPLGTEVFFSTTAQASTVQEMAALFYALVLLVPAALIAFGLMRLLEFHAGTYGRLGRLGTAVSVGALALMGGGLAIEGVDIAFLGQTVLSDVAHGGFLLGFLALMLGSIVLGAAIHVRTVWSVLAGWARSSPLRYPPGS